jgi:Ca2+-binding EF-hand superfamily protein
MASHLTSHTEKKELEKIFKLMDKDGNGTLEREEIGEGYPLHFGIEITKEQVDDMFSAVDLDGNETIDFGEFCMATMSEHDLVTD